MNARVIVTGSRDWSDRRAVWGALRGAWQEAAFGPLIVVHGACPSGADAEAAAWVEMVSGYGAQVVAEPWRALWDLCGPDCADGDGHRVRRRAGDRLHPGDSATYCPTAGPRRNAAMVSVGAAQVLAFLEPRAANRGTRNCIKLARAAGIPVRIYPEGAS